MRWKVRSMWALLLPLPLNRIVRVKPIINFFQKGWIQALMVAVFALPLARLTPLLAVLTPPLAVFTPLLAVFTLMLAVLTPLLRVFTPLQAVVGA